MFKQRVLKLEAPFDCGMTQYGLGATLRMRWLGHLKGGGVQLYPPLPPTYIIEKLNIAKTILFKDPKVYQI